MGLQSTGVATTGSLPTEGVPLVEQLRRVGRDDEGGRGGVCGKKEKPREKNAAKRKILSPTAACNVETLPPSLSLPYLSSSGFFFYLCLFPQPLVLTPHSAHKAKKKNIQVEKICLLITGLLAAPRIQVCVHFFCRPSRESVLLTFSRGLWGSLIP